MSAKIATWQARMSAQFGAVPPSYTEIRAICMQAEIDELRAALAATKAIRTDIVRVCPDRDVECGNRPASWCSTCPLRGACAAPVPQQAAGDARSMDIPTVWTAFRTWAKQHLGRPYSLEHREGIYTDKVTRLCFKGFKAGISANVFHAASPPSEGEPQ